MDRRVLTESGVEFLEDVSDTYLEKGREGVKENFGIEGSKDASPVINMPKEFEDYGKLLTTEIDYVAKFLLRECGTPFYHDRGDSELISSENYIEPLVWLEAQERNDEDLFAPVDAWDADDFRWILMEEVNAIQRHNSLHENAEHIFQNRGWDTYDYEVGLRLGDIVAVDYGMMSPEDGWLLDEADVIGAEQGYWPRSTVPKEEPDYEIIVDLDNIYRKFREDFPSDIESGRMNNGQNMHDSIKALEILRLVNEWLPFEGESPRNSMNLSEAIERGIRDSKTTSALFTSMADYSRMNASYIEGTKLPKNSEEDPKDHSWVSVYLGDTEHLIDPILQNFGRYDQVLEGHEYVEKERSILSPRKDVSNFAENFSVPLEGFPEKLKKVLGGSNYPEI